MQIISIFTCINEQWSMSIALTETSILLWIILSHTCSCTCFWNTVICVLRSLWATLGIQWVILLERHCIILGRAWAGRKLRLGSPHVVDHTCWHEAIHPAGLHGHGVSFTIKPWASRGYVWMVMPCAYLEQTSPPYILLSLTRSLPCHVIIP